MDGMWTASFNKLREAGLPETLGRKKLGYSVLKLKFSAKVISKRKPNKKAFSMDGVERRWRQAYNSPIESYSTESVG